MNNLGSKNSAPIPIFRRAAQDALPVCTRPAYSHGWASRAEATRHPVGLHTAGRYGGGVYATATPTEGVPQHHTIRSRAEP